MWFITTEEDVKKLIIGATLLGTGGGGDPRKGLEYLASILRKVGSIRIVDVDELPHDTVAVVPYYVGSIAPGLRPSKPIRITDPISRALEVLEKELGIRAGAVIASELGGYNTAVALAIGAAIGLPAVDGDLLGRAAPKLHQCTVHIFGIPMYPSVIVSETGNIVIVKEYADIDDYEAIARYLSVLGGGVVAVVDTPLTKDKLRLAAVKNTLSLCYRLGETIIKARAEGLNPIEEAVRVLNGWIVFRGVVEKYVWRDEGGFLKGEVIIRGIDRFEGRRLKSWIMNEHIMVWLDEEPLVMPPDLFILVRDNGEPITNSELAEGMVVNGIAARAPDVWRTPRGLELFGPRHFGFNYDYIPVEELVKIRGLA